VSVLQAIWNRIWDAVVRLRTWLLSIVSIVVAIDPDVVLSLIPDIRAAVPESADRWITVAMIVLTLWSRWRPASRASDPDVKVAKAVAKADGPVVVTVKQEGKAEPIKTVRAK
jgi:hypothetical protein